MLSVTTSEFEPYGYLLNEEFPCAVNYLSTKAKMPREGNIYVRDDIDMKNCPDAKRLQEEVFGLGQMEAGYCNGHNTKLNCLEYHACPEVDLAATDLILLLALPSDIEDGKLDSSKVKAFYVKKGQAVVLRPYVLHFSPCMAKGEPFRCGIYLSAGTNRDLTIKPADPKLWKENKWLFAHRESKQAGLGAYVGITGVNLEVK
jgi:hypothetical protein